MSKVYFTDMRVDLGDSLLNKLDRLIKAAEINKIDFDKKFVAIKTHFGEYGNLAFLRPNYAKVLADLISENNGFPFLTDCNTLYVGNRKNGLEHLETAGLNGFNPTTTGCQNIIGDGLKGTDDVEIPIDGEYIKTAKIGRAVVDSDIIITLNHFKCHELTGIGGAIKNIGMGCASRRGKMELHTSGKTDIDLNACKGCFKCMSVCAHNALSVNEKKISIDKNNCVGCGRCIGICSFDAISCKMDEALDIINYKIVEYAMAVLKNKPNFHVSLIVDVSPFCDCHGGNDLPVIPNIGMLASFDPVALDKACIDLSQKQPMVEGSKLFFNSNGEKPNDIFECIHPDTRWQTMFEHAKKLGFGSSAYELIEIK